MYNMTAVEWLEQKFIKLESTTGVYGKMYEIIDQAKAIEREQIEDAFQDGKWDWDNHLKNGTESKDLVQYYNETYKKDMTSVEWLIDNLKVVLPKDLFNDVVIQDLFKQAKEMDNVTNESVCPKCQSYDWRYNISTDYMKCGDCGFVK